ncbi:hypothetical protein FN846DRAFT_963571 [Sphaerosporella brunnea]|uniref:Uncharacterized protein n=1 Tax=Sphaerosporella brunnea TaxID=1250544 RepID=A0A5J5EMI3_9PEZI|nr:hypothetical protein FN846DRAFT_963571 [Sphaerosporella brunnea]
MSRALVHIGRRGREGWIGLALVLAVFLGRMMGLFTRSARSRALRVLLLGDIRSWSLRVLLLRHVGSWSLRVLLLRGVWSWSLRVLLLRKVRS